MGLVPNLLEERELRGPLLEDHRPALPGDEYFFLTLGERADVRNDGGGIRMMTECLTDRVER